MKKCSKDDDDPPPSSTIQSVRYCYYKAERIRARHCGREEWVFDFPEKSLGQIILCAAVQGRMRGWTQQKILIPGQPVRPGRRRQKNTTASKKVPRCPRRYLAPINTIEARHSGASLAFLAGVLFLQSTRCLPAYSETGVGT